jgi:hypothetical protein
MIIIPGGQRNGAWHEIRRGIPTASKFSEIITPARGDYSKQSIGYMYELAGARVWGVSDDSFKSVDMQNGNDREDAARKAYQAETITEVEQICFAYFDERKDRGCSPDGLCGENGLIEIKSPKLKTHVSYLLSNDYPNEYKCQIQGELYICGREWCDFVSYFPGADLYIKRVYRDEPFIKKLAEAIDRFNVELDALCEKMTKK